MSLLNPGHQEYVHWICDASIDKGKRTIGHLLDRPAEKEPKLDVAKVLGDALGFEVKGQNRRALKNAIQSAMAKLDKQASTAVAKPGKPKPIDGKAAIVKADDLPSLAAGIQFAQEAIESILIKATTEALPIRLRQGLFCLKAQAIWALSPADRAALGGKAKAAKSGSDEAEPEGESEPDEVTDFGGWIATQPISKGSAYDFIGAVKGLGLTAESTEKELTKAYSDARKLAEKDGATLSIAKLKNLAPKESSDDDEEEEKAPDSEALAAEARSQAHHFISTWDKSVKAGNLEHADKETLKQLHEFMTTERDKIGKRLKGAKA